MQHLKNPAVLAAQTLSSRFSVVRAQTVVAHALTEAQFAALDEKLVLPKTSTSTLIIKRIWDETAQRLQIPPESLTKLFPDAFAEQVIQVARESASKYPGYVVQSMQQAAHVRWANGRDGADEIVVPPCLIPTTTAKAIFSAVMQTIPAFDIGPMNKMCEEFRCVVAYMFPDAVPGNKLCMAVYMHEVDKLAAWEAHCAAHNLHLVWRDAASAWDFDNPLYCTSKVLAHAGTSAKVQQGLIRVAAKFKIVVGVPPPPDLGFNSLVVKYTLLRPLISGSYLKRPGTARHDAEEVESLRVSLQKTADETSSVLNAPWFDNVGAHYCWSCKPGEVRCCPNNAAAREKVKLSVGRLGDTSLSSLDMDPARWKSMSSCCVKLGPLSLVHNILKSGLQETLLNPGELQRLRVMVQKAQADGAAGNANHGFDDAMQCWRLLRGKRTLRMEEFVNDPKTQLHYLGILIGTLPLDRMFNSFFDAEKYARERSPSDADVDMLEAMVAEDGLLYEVHAALALPVLAEADASEFSFVQPLCDAIHVEAGVYCRQLRGLQLRLSASLYSRFLLVFWNDPYTLIRILKMDVAEQNAVIDKLVGPRDCRRCDGVFMTRLRESLLRDPVLTREEQREVVIGILKSLTNDPYILSMHIVENFHADARGALSRCVNKKKRLAASLNACQTLGRFITLHRNRLGDLKRTVPSTKKVIRKKLKKPLRKRAGAAGSTRKVSGHNVFCSVRLDEKKAASDEYSYRPAMKDIHREWRAMSEEAKMPWHERAQQGFHTDKRAERAALYHHGLQDVDYNVQHPATPWGLGSLSRPCSGNVLKAAASTLLPEGRIWLRDAYEQALACPRPSSCACAVIPSDRPLDLIQAAKVRASQLRCFEKTPGLCCMAPHYGKIKSLRARLVQAVSSIKPSKSELGELLFVFVSSAARPPAALDKLRGSDFVFMFLSAEPDRRKQWKTFTACASTSVPQSGCLSYPFDVHLKSEDKAFVEYTDYTLAKHLFDLNKNAADWRLHKLTYEDKPERCSEVRVLSASAAVPFVSSEGSTGAKSSKGAASEADDFERAWEAAFATEQEPQPDLLEDGLSSDSSADAVREIDDEQGNEDTDLEEAVNQLKARRQRKMKTKSLKPKSSKNVDVCGPAGQASVEDPDFTRVGTALHWRGKKVGKITGWGNNMSCVCNIHRACKTPAIQAHRLTSDNVLIQWVLDAIDTEGAMVKTREEHIESGKELKEKCLPPGGMRFLFFFVLGRGCVHVFVQIVVVAVGALVTSTAQDWLKHKTKTSPFA